VKCLGLVIANKAEGKIDDDGALRNGLGVVTSKRGARFVNVDITTLQGVKKAALQGLIASNLTDVIIAPSLNLVTDNLLSAKIGRTAKAFTLFRHPIERALSLFHYLAIAHWEPTYDPSLLNMTIEEWVASGKATGGKADDNMMTRTLCGAFKGNLTNYHLDFAKDVIHRKFLVGLTTEMELSWMRFSDYFGWTQSRYPNSEKCIKERVTMGTNKNPHPTVEQGSRGWKTLAAINQWDIALYEYAEDLFWANLNGRELTHADLRRPKGSRHHSFWNETIFFHVGKAGGGTVKAELSKLRVEVPAIHPAPSVRHTKRLHQNETTIVINIRDPVDRFVSAFVWMYRGISLCYPIDKRHTGAQAKHHNVCNRDSTAEEKKLWDKYQGDPNNLAEALCEDSPDQVQAVKDYEKITHSHSLSHWLNSHELSTINRINNIMALTLETQEGNNTHSLEQQTRDLALYLLEKRYGKKSANEILVQSQSAESQAENEGHLHSTKEINTKHRTLSSKGECCLARHLANDYDLIYTMLGEKSGKAPILKSQTNIHPMVSRACSWGSNHQQKLCQSDLRSMLMRRLGHLDISKGTCSSSLDETTNLSQVGGKGSCSNKLEKKETNVHENLTDVVYQDIILPKGFSIPFTKKNSRKYWEFQMLPKGNGVSCRINLEPSSADVSPLRSKKEQYMIHIHGLHHTGTGYLKSLLHEFLNDSSVQNASLTDGGPVSENEGQHLQSIHPSDPYRRVEYERVMDGTGLQMKNNGKIMYLADLCMLESSDQHRKAVGLNLFKQWSPYWNMSATFLVQKTPTLDVGFLEDVKVMPTLHIITVRHPMVAGGDGHLLHGIGWVDGWAHTLGLLNSGCIEWYAVVAYEALVQYKDRVIGELMEVVRSGLQRLGYDSSITDLYARGLHNEDQEVKETPASRRRLHYYSDSMVSYLSPREDALQRWNQCLQMNNCGTLLEQLTKEVLPQFGFVSGGRATVRDVEESELSVQPSTVTVSKEYGHVLFSSEGTALQKYRQQHNHDALDHIGYQPPAELVLKMKNILKFHNA